jgi:glycosyltransferase involved in cell wall biosynthesis
VRHPRVLVEAWALLRERGVRVRFLTVGDAKRLHPEDREAMLALAGEHGVADLFDESGFLDPVDVSRHLQALDAYLYMDHRILTKSGTIMAALEHGLPVIAFHEGTPPPGFRDGTNVRLVRSPEAVGLADAVAELAASRRICEHLAAGARALYEKHYSWPVISERFVRVIVPGMGPLVPR